MAPQAGRERPATQHRYLPALSTDRAVFLSIPHPVQGKQQPTRPYFALPGSLRNFCPHLCNHPNRRQNVRPPPSHVHLSSPPHPFSETPTTKRKVFGKLKERERSKHHDSLTPLARWCESTLPRFGSLSSANIELFTDVVLEEVATSYHNITTPSHPNSLALVKKVKASLQTLPPPNYPNYPASMDTLNKLVGEWKTKVNKAATTKIHQCLVRKTRIKRTINEALNPVERGEITLKRPGATQLVSTPKEVSSFFSSTLPTLGGSLEYATPSTLMDRLLTHSPTCPEPTKHSPLPDITWESFRNTLKRSKPKKAGGRDFTNNYTLHIPPPHPTIHSEGM